MEIDTQELIDGIIAKYDNKVDEKIQAMEDRLYQRMESLSRDIKILKDKYQEDMHGDQNVDNGKLGVIGNVRYIKKTLNDYPSLSYLFAHKPVPTITGGVVVFVILTALYTAGLLRLIGLSLGVNVP